jgi:hypothetical protein
MKRPIINQNGRITPRIQHISKAHEMIGRVLNSNCFSTFRGRLLYIHDEKCYFEILENQDYTKYNECAGQIDYLPEEMVVCMKFEEEE